MGRPVKWCIYVRKYRSLDHDLLWASKGLVVTVLNGEAIPVVQCCIFYAGFENIDIIPLGADKVLVRSTNDGDVSIILSEAAEPQEDVAGSGDVDELVKQLSEDWKKEVREK